GRRANRLAPARCTALLGKHLQMTPHRVPALNAFDVRLVLLRSQIRWIVTLPKTLDQVGGFVSNGTLSGVVNGTVGLINKSARLLGVQQANQIWKIGLLYIVHPNVCN